MNITEVLKLLKKTGYWTRRYHFKRIVLGFISRNTSEELLSSYDEGTFLLRVSSEQEAQLVISVVVNHPVKRIIHTLVKVRSRGLEDHLCPLDECNVCVCVKIK
jgi:hypothetical protein